MSKKDILWKYAYVKDGEGFPRCKFCDKKSSGDINRLKHHWAGTRHGIEPCSKLPDDAKQESQLALKSISTARDKRTELLRKIGDGPGTNYAMDSSGSCPSSGNFPQSRGPMDQFVNVKAKQTTLNSAFKK